jgi:hypothetical protein
MRTLHHLTTYTRVAPRPVLPWFERRVWRDYLQTRLHRRCRRRFTLHLSAHGPLGATDHERRQVYVNPVGLAFPEDPAQHTLVRHAPGDAELWQQQLTLDLIEHEAGHVRFSGSKPGGTLGWLWNTLEDARQEQILGYSLIALGWLIKAVQRGGVCQLARQLHLARICLALGQGS